MGKKRLLSYPFSSWIALLQALRINTIRFLSQLMILISSKTLTHFFVSKWYTIMSGKPIETSIRNKITQQLAPKYLDVINESPHHNVPAGSETHFKVVVVTEQFENKPLLQRHRMVNTILSDELESGVHALSIVAKTPQQWEESDKIVTPSPNCRGGFGK